MKQARAACGWAVRAGTAGFLGALALGATTVALAPWGLFGAPGPFSGYRAWLLIAAAALGAGAALAAVAKHRLAWRGLRRAAAALGRSALPSLARAVEALASGEGTHAPEELDELKSATEALRTALHGDKGKGQRAELAKALLEACQEVEHLAAGIASLASLHKRRLEDLVEERTLALSNANRHLVDSQVRRRQLLDRTVRAAEGERARIAANLHDGPIQRLAAVGIVLDRCRLRFEREDNGGASELLKRAREELTAEIGGLRRMMSELRPPILDEGGLEAAVRDQVSAWAANTGVEARFDAGPHAELDGNSETVVYRIVQEALANVAKHAHASLTTVTLGQVGNGIQVVVRDNGRGFNALSQPELLRKGHFGLVVMRERVELAAGRFEVHSAPGTGTEVTIWLPGTPYAEPRVEPRAEPRAGARMGAA